MKKHLMCMLCFAMLATLLLGCSSESVLQEDSFPPPSYDTPEPEDSAGSNPGDLNTIEDLIAYLNNRKDEGVMVNTVHYPHTLSKSDFDLLCVSTGVMHLSYTSVNDEFTFTMTQYPGNRIAEAHFSGDTSQLNEDEIRVLSIAEDMVSRAKEMTSDPIELELLLHDMLLEKTTYYRGTTEITDVDNPPRHLTAVGSLLDGRANCQGYTDGFYTLATIAGFKVDRMSAFSEGDPHMFNLICLDGQWYVVDATIHDNDANNGDVEYLYPHFNAGLDMCGSLSWYPECEHKPIAKTSPDSYYYNIRNNTPLHNYSKIYTSLSELAEFAIDEHDRNDRRVVHLMLKDRKVSGDEISDALNRAGRNSAHGFGFTYWFNVRGNHTYISIRFS